MGTKYISVLIALWKPRNPDYFLWPDALCAMFQASQSKRFSAEIEGNLF